MKVELWWIGKTKSLYLDNGINDYVKRLEHYTTFIVNGIYEVKNASKMSKEKLKQKEAEKVLEKIPSDSVLILLDERGKEFDSVEFATFIQNQMNYSSKKLIFLVGGAFGFDPMLYKRANYKLSLSKMTFSHQMVRLFFVEQLYRAFTIIHNEKYHNS